MEVKKQQDHNVVALPVDSWYGAKQLDYLFRWKEFRFPKSWDIEVFEPEGLAEVQPLGREQIRQQLQHPIASDPLRKLAESRRSAAIIVDDLTRPTPAFAVVPAILEELGAGGIREESIKIIIGLGTHRPPKKFEQQRKLGREVVERVEVINHNAFTTRIKRYKRPGGGPDIGIHRAVGDADLKIALSSLNPHGGAGFGGGAKAVLPAVADYRTIRFNHEYAWEERGTIYPEEIQSACIRKDMEETARIVGLDFSINLVVTPFKEVVGVFGGDVVRAHREGCVRARDLYLTRVPVEQLDVVVANGYPFDTDISQSHRGSWPEKYGRAGVLVGRAGDGWPYHGDHGKSYKVYRRMKREQQPVAGYQFKGTREYGVENPRYFFSETLDPAVFYERSTPRILFNEWDELIDELDMGKKPARVGIFPYASLQLEHQEG